MILRRRIPIMAKKNRVSINSIDKIIATFDTSECAINYGDITVNVKTAIRLADYSQMIKDVVYMIFDTNTGKYNYEYVSFAVKYQIIKYFTNLSTDNVGKIFDLVNKTDIMQKIDDIIRPSIETIENDAFEAVDFIKQTVYKTSPWDEVAEIAKEMLGKLSASTEKLGAVKDEDLHKIINIFNHISADDIKEMALQKTRENGQS
jgi:hypothetical protein